MSFKFRFFNTNLTKTKLTKNTQKPVQYVRGDARLSMGLYRTPAESEEYKIKSLKRKLP